MGSSRDAEYLNCVRLVAEQQTTSQLYFMARARGAFGRGAQMTREEARFISCRESSEVYCKSFHSLGKEITAEMAKGSLESAAGALMHLEGETAAYFFVQQLADHIASKIVERGGA